jgi:coenzyme F420-reducing hydrogenase alpha subunit
MSKSEDLFGITYRKGDVIFSEGDMVATQFNNAYINLLIRDLAEKHLDGDNISQEGEKLIGRCVRIFDPCLSCATH